MSIRVKKRETIGWVLYAKLPCSLSDSFAKKKKGKKKSQMVDENEKNNPDVVSAWFISPTSSWSDWEFHNFRVPPTSFMELKNVDRWVGGSEIVKFSIRFGEEEW